MINRMLSTIPVIRNHLTSLFLCFSVVQKKEKLCVFSILTTKTFDLNKYASAFILLSAV